MTLNAEQTAEYVKTIQAIQGLLDEARGNPDIWLARRGEYFELSQKLDGFDAHIADD